MNGLKWLSGTRTQNQEAAEAGRPEKRIVSRAGRQNRSLQEQSLADLVTKMLLEIIFYVSVYPLIVRYLSIPHYKPGTGLSARNIIRHCSYPQG